MTKNSNLIVLGYHDVSGRGDISSWLKVKATAFERQIGLLKKIGTFIRPEDLYLPDMLKKNRLNLLLTFDDGYSSNFKVAFPIIKHYQIPALFFISTWNMQTGQPFWFDKIIRPIQSNRIASLDLRHLGLKKYHFSGWRAAFRWDDIHNLLEDLKKGEMKKRGIIDEAWACLQRTCTTDESGRGENSDQPISPDQILEMYRSGFCFFGSHSHQHMILNSLSDVEIAEDLKKSRMILESIIGSKVHQISYPNGDADDRIILAARNAGYRLGFTTRRGRVNVQSDEMNIPRLLVGGFDSSLRVLWKVGWQYMQ
jgi:peptidoglycan/xylan/chitin deacetylase (PgdA/CDA1 family)